MGNPTALRSKRLLKESFLDLLKSKPLSAISVGEVCERAQLTRPTFYNHFNSKADIAGAIIDDAFEAYESVIVARGVDSTEGMLRTFLEFWGHNQDLLAIITGNGLLPMVSERFKPHLERIYTRSPFTDKSRDANELAFHNSFLAAGMAGLLGEWARFGTAVEAEDISGYMAHMIETLNVGMEREPR